MRLIGRQSPFRNARPQNERNVGVAARHGIAERRPVHGVQTAQAVIGWVGVADEIWRQGIEDRLSCGVVTM